MLHIALSWNPRAPQCASPAPSWRSSLAAVVVTACGVLLVSAYRVSAPTERYAAAPSSSPAHRPFRFPGRSGPAGPAPREGAHTRGAGASRRLRSGRRHRHPETGPCGPGLRAEGRRSWPRGSRHLRARVGQRGPDAVRAPRRAAPVGPDDVVIDAGTRQSRPPQAGRERPARLHARCATADGGRHRSHHSALRRQATVFVTDQETTGSQATLRGSTPWVSARTRQQPGHRCSRRTSRGRT